MEWLCSSSRELWTPISTTAVFTISTFNNIIMFIMIMQITRFSSSALCSLSAPASAEALMNQHLLTNMQHEDWTSTTTKEACNLFIRFNKFCVQSPDPIKVYIWNYTYKSSKPHIWRIRANMRLIAHIQNIFSLMHHVMLNASTFSPSLSFDYREYPSDNSHNFFLSHRNKSAEELSVPVPCMLSSRHFTLPIMHSFSLQNKSLADLRTARPLPQKHDIRHVRKWGETSKQTEESRERLFSLPAALFSHQSPLHTNTGELVLTYWNGRRSNVWLIIPS